MIMDKCKCDLMTKLVGDGCQHCNPQITIDSLIEEIQTLRAKVASADVLVEALREITYSHDGYARKKAEQALATYDKLSEVKHDTNK